MAVDRGAYIQHAPFGHVDVIHIVRELHLIFDFGRLVGGRPLEQVEPGEKGLRQDETVAASEHVEAARTGGRLDADRDREAARLNDRIRDRAEDEKPVVVMQERRRQAARDSGRLAVFAVFFAGDAQGSVTLEHVLVIWIAGRMAHGAAHAASVGVLRQCTAQGFHQTPAIGDRKIITVRRKGFGWGRAHGIPVFLGDAVGQRLVETGGDGRPSISASSGVTSGGGGGSSAAATVAFAGGMGAAWAARSNTNTQRPSHTFCALVSRNGANGQEI